MPRVKRSTKRNDRRKKILKRASGYFLTKSKLYQAAQEAVERSLKFAYTGRKQKKRQFRALWIVRINAACRINGMSYSTFINGLKLAGNGLDRKVLADIAANDAAGFAALTVQARAALKVAADQHAKKQANTAAKIKAVRYSRRGFGRASSFEFTEWIAQSQA
jgi:large subunit ribosomal protein L20